MFRFLTLIGLGVCVLDMVLTAFQTRRVFFMWGTFIERRTNPVGFWLMTMLWSATVALAVAGVPVLLYHAFNGSGPYKDHSFFSLHQFWPYGVLALVVGWLAIKMIKDRLQQSTRKDGDPAA
jgi:hypothetical protein